MNKYDLTLIQYLSLADLPENAIAVMQKAAKRCKTSYFAWTSFTDLLMYVQILQILRILTILQKAGSIP
jgi:hypothetical protein